MPIVTRNQTPMTTPPSGAPGTSLAYITIGGIMAVLAGTSYFFFDATNSPIIGYVRTSVLVLGILGVLVGFGVGQIARTARKADLPPRESTNPLVQP